MRTIIRAPARFYGTRVRMLLGASSCSAKSKASVVVPERSAPRTRAAFQAPCGRNPGAGTGPRRAYRAGGRSGTPGPIGGTRILWHLHPCVGFRRIVTSQTHPDARAETCPPRRATENRRMRCPGNASGAPGRGAAAKPRQAWLPSVHLLCQPGRPLPVLPGLTRLPRLVARGYLAAVPGRVNVRSTFLRRNHRPAKPWRVTNS